MHDECNGSDVFGSDICTCRPYLVHGIDECVKQAQKGGVGLIVYNRKEGRALGEVTKFLVYNARKRQEGGDQAATYFERTECVAGVQDARFQQLMPDVLHWLGITRIDRFVSMSNMKYDAIVSTGIEIVERVPIPEGLVPAGCAGRNRGQEGRRLLHAGSRTDGERTEIRGRPGSQRVLTLSNSHPPKADTDAALLLLTASAVRSRAHEMLELGLAGRLPNFRVDLSRLEFDGGVCRRGHSQELSGSACAPARALAALCFLRPGFLGRHRGRA